MRGFLKSGNDFCMIISIIQDGKSGNIPLTPEAVSILVQNHYTVLIDGDASDRKLANYLNVGAYLINSKEELLDRGDLLIKKVHPVAFEIDYVNAESKIFFTKIDIQQKELIKQILVHKISIIDYSHLPGIKKKRVDVNNQVAFSNYTLPFLLRLCSMGLNALVDDEQLREALLVMHGKIYDHALAARYKYTCYEF